MQSLISNRLAFGFGFPLSQLLLLQPQKICSRTRLRSFSASSVNQSRGGLPRFYSQTLPHSKDGIVRVQGDEFWHMTKVLRLSESDRVELFNGTGGVVKGCIQRIDRAGLDFMALEDPEVIPLEGTQWHVYAAFGTLKGGRADWLVEKCTELGASSVTPLLTERSPSIAENRVDRLERVVLAAIKQCQRLHGMTLNPPIKVGSLLPIVAHSKLSFLAAAEATPLIGTLSSLRPDAGGLIIIGPEGGAAPVGLGPCRLRVETATIALLATLMLWSDSHSPDLNFRFLSAFCTTETEIRKELTVTTSRLKVLEAPLETEEKKPLLFWFTSDEQREREREMANQLVENLVESIKSKVRSLKRSRKKKPYVMMDKSSSVKVEIRSRKARNLIDKTLKVADSPGKKSIS
ncbi:ribosomal RNA small subunit methyltransferase E [Cinnamomum micranthum f. kanehirae]|uniref:16S rRNA (uracil(1498)-N(3))-methyltransferase n=2 Tax=Lauraceae TaxID=3433 RepID=A0A443N5Z1_9MAGN|nr:ribosomal RNA small subunit methyltransferase E [Cinnamomum micranthum f. kanehirae]